MDCDQVPPPPGGVHIPSVALQGLSLLAPALPRGIQLFPLSWPPTGTFLILSYVFTLVPAAFPLRSLLPCLSFPARTWCLRLSPGLSARTWCRRLSGSLPGSLQLGLTFAGAPGTRDHPGVLASGLLTLWCRGLSRSMAGTVVRLRAHIDLISKPTLYLPGGFGQDI